MFNEFIFNQILKRLENLKIGSLKIITPDQKTYEFQGHIDGLAADIIIKDWRVIGNLASKGDIGFAEDYRDGLWDTSDLTALLTISIHNRSILDPFFSADKLRNFLYQISYFFKRNSVDGSRKNIHAHYDLGNNFYKLWLDPTMTYSSALFDSEEDDLVTAQNRKYNRIVDKLSGDSGNLLEIGCGWGGFADQALKRNKDFDIKGITLSDEQHSFAKERLKNNASIVLEDYRHQEGQYDHIVSIEMFEAVGEKYWPSYFAKVTESLKPSARAALQIITIRDELFQRYRKRADFIHRYIFPGGMLPSETALRQQTDLAGLQIEDTHYFGPDYAETLRLWARAFEDRWAEISQQGFDEKFRRMWRFYLSYCEAGFDNGRINVGHFRLAKA